MLQDNDFKTRHDSNLVTLQGLKKECDDARYHLNEKSRSNNDCQSEIAALREQISRREAEIFSGQRDVQQKSDHAYAIRKEMDSLSFELQKLKEERQRDQIEIDRLRELSAIKERENADQDQRIKTADYDLFKLQERAAELSKIAEMRESDLRRTSEQYEAAHLDLLKSRDEQARLHDEQQNFSRQLDMKLAEKNDLARRSDQELGRNRGLTTNLYDFEAKTRATEEALGVTRRELDDLRFSNQSLQGRNDDVRAEIDALHYHCNVLQGQNRDLNVELERFVQTDEQIRTTLNRRDRVETLRQKSEFEAHQSYKQVERASPVRSSHGHSHGHGHSSHHYHH